jgi:type II restriction/modification system DNA methylase subunit YeeA
METTKLKKFAQYARHSLMIQIAIKLKQVLAEESAARRESAEAIRKLEEAMHLQGKDHVIEWVAYIWFNRFCALRFMDVNRYTRIGVVSPAEGQFQPEILAEAKMGHIDEEMVSEKARQQIYALLDGKAPSHDPQGEAYRLLVVAACNHWNKAMPFLFERIDDYTELLMPDDLLSGNSILAYTREAITPGTCKDTKTEEPIVEVIGWLYQFYISEKKDEVFEGLKKNKKITPENIPAATQLFTPPWIVRYLVENSLGRLWMLNRPNSKIFQNLKDRGEACYYIEPKQPETGFLRISKPEEIKVCDPACGSGHMLTYAFDLLYAIYEEEGYEPAEIPENILTHNLYGIEIDERAGELAAFALTMKARAKQRRFFNKGVKPNICVLGNVQFDEDELKNYMDFVGRDLFTEPLQTTLRQFEETDNFGSLIRPDVIDVDGMLRILESKNFSSDWIYEKAHQKTLQALRQADYLSPKYHVVIANPPYMGSKGMNGRLGAWAKDNYPDSNSDLFAMFIERSLDLAKPQGAIAMITMQSWMFLSSFEPLRNRILEQHTILSMEHIGERGFDSIGGAVVSTSAFVISNEHMFDYKSTFLRLIEGKSEREKSSLALEAIRNKTSKNRYEADASTFKKIPAGVIAYWASQTLCDAFEKLPALSEIATPKQGLATGDNGRFTRMWSEVNKHEIDFSIKSFFESNRPNIKWVPYSKGGGYRRWYGFADTIVFWENGGSEIRNFKDSKGNERSRFRGYDFYFLPAATWGKIGTGSFSCRYRASGYVFDVGGMSIFPKKGHPASLTGLLNSKTSELFLKILSSTLNYELGDVAKIPVTSTMLTDDRIIDISTNCIKLSKFDWDAYETAWDFTSLPLLNPNYRQSTLMATYQKLRAHWREITQEMQQLEEENNRIFINAYGLRDELDEKIDLNEITLTCNPHYRYGNNKSEEELEALLLVDSMRELVSYAVGCMFGRYALDKPGFILANQGETIDDYLKQIPEPSFPADDDNVIPMLDGDWFTDDIAERFRKFLRVAFGEEHYEENLRFVEQALNIKGKRNYSIRDYFLGEFYNDHVKRYKKRPIYWLFTSPKGSFNALIYMHRYRPDTVGVVLNDYLREFRTKLTAHKSHLEAVSINPNALQGEKTKALKEIENLRKIIDELDTYEREVLYPLATEQKEIDLDKGVKFNYGQFGQALKKIVGLDAQED